MQNWYSHFSEVLQNYFETHLPSARIKQCQTKPPKIRNQIFITNKATSFSGVLHSLASLCSYILNTPTSKPFLGVSEWVSTSSFSWAGLHHNFLSLQTDYALNKRVWCIKKKVNDVVNSKMPRNAARWHIQSVISKQILIAICKEIAQDVKVSWDHNHNLLLSTEWELVWNSMWIPTVMMNVGHYIFSACSWPLNFCSSNQCFLNVCFQ